jgi:prophage regulatory protein
MQQRICVGFFSPVRCITLEKVMAIIRLPAVKAEFGYRSHASVYNAIRDGLFTKPVSIGARSVGWPEYEVKAICSARIAGKQDSEIRQLVELLHAKRVEQNDMLEMRV